jgi:hypothetical protein
VTDSPGGSSSSSSSKVAAWLDMMVCLHSSLQCPFIQVAQHTAIGTGQAEGHRITAWDEQQKEKQTRPDQVITSTKLTNMAEDFCMCSIAIF